MVRPRLLAVTALLAVSLPAIAALEEGVCNSKGCEDDESDTSSLMSLRPKAFSDVAEDRNLLRLRLVKNAPARSAVCNDGSPAAYWTSIVPGAKRWLFSLEGGAGCYNTKSCEDRNRTQPWLISSRPLPEIRTLTEFPAGMFSRDCTENPVFCEASFVYVHYCSSDWWTGTARSGPSGFRFLGKSILKAVLEDTMAMPEFCSAKDFVLAGQSAGGVGVFQNADMLASQLAAKAPDVKFSAFTDSAWFSGGPSLTEWPCNTTFYCNQEETFILGIKIWKSQLQEACVAAMPCDLVWKCLFSYNAHKFVEARIFTVHFLTDAWTAKQDGIDQWKSSDLTAEQAQWVEARGVQTYALTKQLPPSRGVFAMNCFEHGAAGYGNDGYWVRKIEGTSAAEAHDSWLRGEAVQFIDSPGAIDGNPTCGKHASR